MRYLVFCMLSICLRICLRCFLLEAFARSGGEVVGGTLLHDVIDYMGTPMLLQKIKVFSILLREKLQGTRLSVQNIYEKEAGSLVLTVQYFS